MKKTLIKFIAILLLTVMCIGSLYSCKREANFVKLTVKDMGEIVIRLDREQAPKTVDNFVRLVESGFYNGLTFQRVIKGFMIQGGCPNFDCTGNTGSFIEGEFSANNHPNSIRHSRGVVSMARGSSPNSASCQFFICSDNAYHLDGYYAAFGYVVAGMDIVDAIIDATAHLAVNAIVPRDSQIVIERADTLVEY